MDQYRGIHPAARARTGAPAVVRRTRGRGSDAAAHAPRVSPESPDTFSVTKQWRSPRSDTAGLAAHDGRTTPPPRSRGDSRNLAALAVSLAPNPACLPLHAPHVARLHYCESSFLLPPPLAASPLEEFLLIYTAAIGVLLQHIIHCYSSQQDSLLSKSTPRSVPQPKTHAARAR